MSSSVKSEGRSIQNEKALVFQSLLCYPVVNKFRERQRSASPPGMPAESSAIVQAQLLKDALGSLFQAQLWL